MVRVVRAKVSGNESVSEPCKRARMKKGRWEWEGR